jgi:membrane associated rhomboid family serine protease
VSFDAAGPDIQRFRIGGRPDGIALGPEGFHHPRTPRGRGRAYTRYGELTHLAKSDRFVWVGSRRSVTMLARQSFGDARDPERLLAALLDRVGELPGGVQQLARMAEVEALARRSPSRIVTWGLAALCLVGFALELLMSPEVFTVGYFSRRLVVDGDLWRIVTGNLLHGFPLHLVLNLAGLLVVGRMAERALGAARTGVVVGASALGSMATSGLLSGDSVVGVSGVVFGLAGALLWLELRRGSELPAWWRFPRPMLGAVLLAFLVDVALGFWVPFIAGEAHLGGLAAGALTTAAMAPPGSLGRRAGPRVRLGAAAVAAVTALAVLAAATELLGEDDFVARHAARLARLPGVAPDELNNHAWFIAIDPESTRPELEAALLLAERAVIETQGRRAALLDTLAEVQFQLGWSEQAVATIDAAIARDPDEPYYREQRRRFIGERAADDRPPDPALQPRRPAEPAGLPPDDQGLRV